MRRKDREMDREFGLDIIDKSNYGIISMIDEEGKPYGIPLSIVRDEDMLYFHTGMKGKKVEALEKKPNVSVSFVGEVKVPEIYTDEELELMNTDPSKAAQFISGVFTTEFESAIVKGSVKLIEDIEEKIKGMKLICEKYTPTKMKYFDAAIKSSLSVTSIYSITIEEITAKRKKYDPKGIEMKWGRMK